MKKVAMNFVKSKNSIFGGIIAAILSVIIFSIVYEIWNINLLIPSFCAHGDGMSTLTDLRNYLDHGWLYFFEGMAAPYGCEVPGNATDGLLNYATLYILVQIVKEPGLALNLFYILTYPLTTLCTYIVLKRLGFSTNWAITGSILYCFLPFHYLRTMHLNLFTFFMIPLCCLGMVRLVQIERKVNRADYVISAIGCAITGVESLYFAAFTMIIFCFIAVWMLIEKKWKRVLGAIGLCVITGVFCVLVMLLPAFQGANVGGSLAGVSRSVRDFNEYGLRLWAMLMPVIGHRVRFLGELTREYYETFAVSWDAYTVPLGGMMSVGFVISIIHSFLNHNKLCSYCGKLNLFLILLAITDGLDVIIGYFITSSIRCYNRVSVYIAFFSLIVLLYSLSSINNKKNENIFRCANIWPLLILILGIWDQTPYWMDDNIRIDEQNPHNVCETFEEYEARYREEQKYFAEIEAKVDIDGNVFVFPLDEGEKYPEGYRYTKNVNWNYNRQSSKENDYTQWMLELDVLELGEQIAEVKFVGASGALFLKECYEEEEFLEIEKKMIQLTGEEAFISSDGNMYFWSLK